MHIAEIKNVSKAPVINSEMSQNHTATPVGVVFRTDAMPKSLKEKFLYATFEIIAEQGADALSANELIRKTHSSKGALFHHFKTLDDLCLESLSYFKEYIKNSIQLPQCSNLTEFLKAFVTDTEQRQCNKYFFHASHFFKDRALRDERFRVQIQEMFNIYTETTTEAVMKYLASGTDRAQVRSVMVFMNLTLERMCYHKVVMNSPESIETMVPWLTDLVAEKLQAAKPSGLA